MGFSANNGSSGYGCAGALVTYALGVASGAFVMLGQVSSAPPEEPEVRLAGPSDVSSAHPRPAAQPTNEPCPKETTACDCAATESDDRTKAFDIESLSVVYSPEWVDDEVARLSDGCPQEVELATDCDQYPCLVALVGPREMALSLDLCGPSPLPESLSSVFASVSVLSSESKVVVLPVGPSDDGAFAPIGDEDLAHHEIAMRSREFALALIQSDP